MNSETMSQLTRTINEGMLMTIIYDDRFSTGLTWINEHESVARTRRTMNMSLPIWQDETMNMKYIITRWPREIYNMDTMNNDMKTQQS